MKRYILCIISAICCGMAFILPDMWILLLIAPSLFAYVLFNTEYSYFKLGFVFGFCFYLVNSSFLLSLDISWLVTSELLSILLPVVAWLAVSVTEGVFCGLFALCFGFLKKKALCYPLLFSSLWVLYEALIGLSRFKLGYTWGRISLPFAACPAIIQTASFFGMLFISFLIIFFSSSLAYAVYGKSKRPLILAVSLILLNCVCSLVLFYIPENGEKISASVIQSGQGSLEKWRVSSNDAARETAEEIKDSELILFPETVIPMYLNNSPWCDMLAEKAKNNGCTALVGALYHPTSDINNTSIYMFSDDKTKIYSKQHLVPFGEYYPVADLFLPELKEIEISPGDSALPLISGKINSGCLVCFDSIFPCHAQKTTKLGANIICIATNDSWFSKNRSAALHYYHSIYRSIENGRYCLRSACTGISAVINSKGQTLSALYGTGKGRIDEDVLLISDKTPYTLYSDFPIIIYSLFAVVFLTVKCKKNR